MATASWRLRIMTIAAGCVLAAGGIVSAQSTVASAAQSQVQKPSIGHPNVVIIFADDLGYADLSCFGGDHIETLNLDEMASQGRRLTSFYVAQAVCSASRAALLTGCYSNRVGIQGALGPKAKIGLNPDEMTIAEVLKQSGYATCAIGKWHLGDNPKFLPTRQGFDEYFGLPYSNDMWPFHPTSKSFPDLPLIQQEEVINPSVTAEDQKQLTRQYTEHAVDFIRRNADKPFFCYLAHSMPHVPIFAGEKFDGKTGKGLFADVIAEVDWSVGEVLKTLRELKLDEKTLVIFTSDNGPWLSYGNHAGSAKPLREGKGTAWEGGVREPFVAWWPGQIPAGSVSDEMAATIDILPTLAFLTNSPLPQRDLDGKNVWSLLSGDNLAATPHDAYYYYWGGELHAVRSGDWKLHFPHNYRTVAGEPGKDGVPGPYRQGKCGLELYDLGSDIGEQRNVVDSHPEVVQRLKELANDMRAQLGDTLTKSIGSDQRPPGRL